MNGAILMLEKKAAGRMKMMSTMERDSGAGA